MAVLTASKQLIPLENDLFIETEVSIRKIHRIFENEKKNLKFSIRIFFIELLQWDGLV